MQEGGFGQQPPGGQPEPGWGQPSGGPPPGAGGPPPPAGPVPPAPDAAERVTPPAIALIVYASLGVVVQLLGLLASLTGVGLDALKREVPMEGLLGGGLSIAGAIIGLAVAGFIIYGALQMRNLRSHVLGIVAAVMAFVPFVNPCCCFIGLAPGGWALFILLKPEIKAAFQS
jgi:hypothetical protein